MQRIRQSLFALVVIALITLTAGAQDAPSFLIEKIDVRGARFASATVVARETLLVVGQAYSEPQLRAAMSRINRLPFVLDSSFALEKGSDRGAYVLVITIVETKPLFVEAQSQFTKTNESRTNNQEYVRSGARWFFGSSSLVHASTDFKDNYEAGITQYNLFGHPGYVTLNVRWTTNQGPWQLAYDGKIHTYDYKVDPVPEIRFGIPLFGNHSIQGQWAYGKSTLDITSAEGSEGFTQRSHSSDLAWVWDTTDDPVLPTSGSLWRTGVAFGATEVESESSTGQPLLRPGDSRRGSFTSKFQHYRPVNSAVSILYGGSAGVSRFETDGIEGQPMLETETTSWGVSPEVGVTTALWPDRLTRKFGDLRWETRVAYNWAGGSRNFYSADSLSAETAIVQRNVWGTLRLGFSYANYDLREFR